ncbi:acyl-CoA dehydratase activase [Geosporobacter ferrireducens]|uniref:2-hydroxyglutaryl-CoA dehydratase n=2 Tax=Geosporobacter ferrireducens TaxID=1424294 RepID=A0A1D8GHD7_9FIRM|nr:acyl-CoA dehydratase activase [Geosporobacter ferrireducens]AOT70316.1 2-hydroxyglutaryl-CoA dehydratase [Geosporobacter ferrireducens]MTI54284.1 2-hydroxyglutaryl-CoA dehydratase [Geosporobacter ferrireducens]
MGYYIGIDVGSVTTKLALIEKQGKMVWDTYMRTEGGPIETIQKSFLQLSREMGDLDQEIKGIGTTGSGRHLAAVMVGADIVKNEITAHAAAAKHVDPQVRTVIDIGGQDSKIIFIKNGVSTGFNMNSICAAGTGSFLDHQAGRLGIPIEEFGAYALKSYSPVKISGRCGVFAESDLIHKQQMGYKKEDLIAGLCIALVGNYLSNVARGKRIEPAVLFQGGVAANLGIKAAFEQRLGIPITVPRHHNVMGAWGAALLAKQCHERTGYASAFRGIKPIASFSCVPKTFSCSDCSNHCEINELYIGESLASRWGSRCNKWSDLERSSKNYREERDFPLQGFRRQVSS